MRTPQEIKEYIRKTFPKYKPTPDKDAQIIAAKITELMKSGLGAKSHGGKES